MDLTRLFSRRARASLKDMAMSKSITKRSGYSKVLIRRQETFDLLVTRNLVRVETFE